MKPHPFLRIPRALVIALSFVATASNTLAHCDGLDGPVVQAAQEALKTNNVNLVLIWVKKEDESEIRKAFVKTAAVRKLGDEAREMADRSFFETLVRMHRAGEGASFTGLKPAGRDLGPAIPAADKALREGDPGSLHQLLVEAVSHGLSEHFAEALSKKNFDPNDVEAGRAFVKAYVEYIHSVEAIYARATASAHGHFPEKNNASVHGED
jgi:hypothetical protein